MQQENNLENFKNIYDFTKRNYNIIIHGLAGIGKFNFILSIIDYYYEKFEISKNSTKQTRIIKKTFFSIENFITFDV